MPNDDTNATIDPNPAQEPNDEWRQRGAEILQAIATAQLDPMYRFENDPGLYGLRSDDDSDYDERPEDSKQDSKPRLLEGVACKHCHQFNVVYMVRGETLEESRSSCNNCGPLECEQCETTLQSRPEEISGAGPELYCPYCEQSERDGRLDYSTHDESDRFHGYLSPLSLSPLHLRRYGKTERDREKRETLEAKAAPKHFTFKALAHRRGNWLACPMPVEITVEPGERIDGKSCTIAYSATTESRVYEKRSLSTRNQYMPDTVELSPSTRGLHFRFWRWTRPYIMGIADEWVVELRGCTELFDFLREHRLLPKHHKRMTQGRLSRADRRLFEEENARPTSELNPPRSRKRDFYAPRPDDLRYGRKPIRPWTRQQRGVLTADERLLREPEPRQAHPDQPTDLELENGARGIELPPPTRKESRSWRARRNDLGIDPWRMPTWTLAWVEKRAVDPFDYPPVSVMGNDVSRPLTSKLGRVLLRWPRSR